MTTTPPFPSEKIVLLEPPMLLFVIVNPPPAPTSLDCKFFMFTDPSDELNCEIWKEPSGVFPTIMLPFKGVPLRYRLDGSV